jgi:hypothetical protein
MFISGIISMSSIAPMISPRMIIIAGSMTAVIFIRLREAASL